MRKEATTKRKRVSKAARQKQKLMITGGLAVVLLILIIILGVFFFGSCGTNYADVEENTIFILDNGKIISTDVEAFDESKYDTDSLESYVKSSIDTYNNEAGEKVLKQKSFDVEDGVATLVLEYANAKTYETFNGIEFFTGTVKEAQEAGYTFEGSFAKMVDGKAIAATADDFANADGYKVVIIKSNTKVNLMSGEIAFVSTQNISKVGDGYVVIKDGCQLLTEELDTESAFGTEAEGSDDSISEEELLTDDENDMVFDFGETDESGSQYSDVLTYIIYK